MSSAKALVSVLIVSTVFASAYFARRWGRRNSSPQPTASRIDELDNPLLERSGRVYPDLKDWIRTRPKVELHCHLNGAVRPSTLRELLPPHANPASEVVHTIEDAFAMFRNVYEAINNQASLRRIVKEFLEDCIKDNVRYVELRTTPRKLTDVNSRRDYVRIVVDEISSFENLHSQRPLTSFPTGKIAARLILTVDRTQPVSVAEQTVDIALRFSEWVVGLDFAGNPTVGTFADFLGVFERARGHGLFTTVHTSEIRNVEEETEAIVNFRPDRVGHFLFPTADQISKLVSAGIAIESCPTSNICAISGKSPTDGDLTAHSIIETFINTRPDLLSINTDDPGVFGVSLSDELRAVAQSFNLDQNAIQRMIVASARHAFLTKQERESLASVLSM